MSNDKLIEKMLSEVAKGSVPDRILERYLQEAESIIHRDDAIVEDLMAFYPDLSNEDVKIFDKLMDRYYNDSEYSIVNMLSDLSGKSISSGLKRRISWINKKFDIKPTGGDNERQV